YVQYYSNLTTANSVGNPVWEVEYTASTTYNMKGLSISDWLVTLNSFAETNSTTWKLYKFYLFA
ncbi:4352_t:CDS:1, partial [Acaulospora colombiana]